jgi:hypothetical protein
MALEGKFGDTPNYAIFADTGWEPKEVYEWLELLKAEVASFPIVTVSAGNIKTDAEAGCVTTSSNGKPHRFAALPFYLKVPTGVGSAWSAGMGRRQCSSEYKINPIRRWVRQQGVKPVEMWIGISTDEASRMKPSNVKYITHRWPLIEAGLNREACQNYIVERMGKKAPKSSCIGCPFHGDDCWAKLKAESPEEFAEAVAFDEAIRRTERMRADQFLHKSLVPLGQIKEFKHENQGRMFVDGLDNECSGVCGT